jgi:hypothetical protein
MLKPLPLAGFPIAGQYPPTIAWQQYFTSLDQAVQSAPTFPTPEITLNAATGQTLTADQLLAGILLRTGPAGAFSDTTPTAAQILAAIPKGDINSNRMVLIRNGGGGLMTLLAGTGVTLRGTTTIAAGNGRFYLVSITAKAVGSEAVNLRGLITGAM